MPPQESATTVKARLLQDVHDGNNTLEERRSVPRVLIETEWLLPTHLPAALPVGDDRFNPAKKKRVFVCDVCGLVVPFSSAQAATYYK